MATTPAIVLGPTTAASLRDLLAERGGLKRDGTSVIRKDQFAGVSILEGVLDGHLLPASVDGATETTAEMSVYRGSGDGWGDKSQNVTVTNRSAGIFWPSGTLLQVVRINNEWRPLIPFSWGIGKADAAMTGPASAGGTPDADAVSVWSGASGASLSDTGENIDVYDRFGDLSSGSWVAWMGTRHGMEILQGQCP